MTAPPPAPRRQKQRLSPGVGRTKGVRNLPMPAAWAALLAPYRVSPAPTGPDPLESNAVHLPPLGPLLDRVFAPLDERRTTILWHRWALGESLQTVAAHLNVSRERVRVLEEGGAYALQDDAKTLLSELRGHGLTDAWGLLRTPPRDAATGAADSRVFPGATPDQLWALSEGLLQALQRRGSSGRRPAEGGASWAQTPRLHSVNLAPGLWLRDRADRGVSLEHYAWHVRAQRQFVTLTPREPGRREVSAGYGVFEPSSDARTRALVRRYSAALGAEELLSTEGGVHAHREWTGQQWLTAAAEVLAEHGVTDWHVSEMAQALAYLWPHRYADLTGVQVGSLTRTLTPLGARPLIQTGQIGRWRLGHPGERRTVREALHALLSGTRRPLRVQELMTALEQQGRRVSRQTLNAELQTGHYLVQDGHVRLAHLPPRKRP